MVHQRYDMSPTAAWLRRVFGYGGLLHRRGIARRHARGVWR